MCACKDCGTRTDPGARAYFDACDEDLSACSLAALFNRMRIGIERDVRAHRNVIADIDDTFPYDTKAMVDKAAFADD